jgi:hypothetical protein
MEYIIVTVWYRDDTKKTGALMPVWKNAKKRVEKEPGNCFKDVLEIFHLKFPCDSP